MAKDLLPQIRSELEKIHRETLTSGKPKFLFRGQSQVSPSVNSTFARIDASDECLVGQACKTFRYAKIICKGLRGYTINQLEGMAVLQHYGWPTPLIDLTGTPEVAVFFALQNAEVGDRAVIYSIDCNKLPENAIIVDHDFFTHELDDGGLSNRWIRQDGFAIAPNNWQDALACREFDLLASRFSNVVTPYVFTVQAGDKPNINNVYSIKGDPIPKHLQNLLRLFCRDTFGNTLHRHLQSIINSIFP